MSVIRAGESAEGPFSLVVTPASAGWEYSSLRVLELPAGGSATFDTGEDETIVLPLSGSCLVECDGERFELVGRGDVFSRVTDFAYAPRDAQVTVTSEAGGRFALPAARATRRLTARYGPAEGVSVELRGAGQASRQVNNFCMPGTFDADALIAVEVLTPGANWSSFPPHKHDEEREGESVLEEIYYFEVAAGPGGTAGTGYQRVSTSGPGREIDVCAEVRSGDTVLIPHGWHGPSMATPGYDLYYLNVMAGPGDERAWRICDHPDHAWVRGTWDAAAIDPRLPLTTTEAK
ncbi:5-deoxy-glucuronate isomerase [Pseudonocardia abyssalis]|uniref:5-deoxy-glucuronate isomerase n=1 Tax=Pseudonocardia abyssalis TaxID=2792008 RepID=A0ABS6UPC1_9PSEU|nr:5-deoxy-glucuronate isomerase [Pseudonocardia abyssalis]MBW0117810.1 5-deoxy-glucuronate isomerase [Pseudonocardia abyssalis]MBW0134067.1 5-deoxy-glucuronate isomerase [Pseudonocardia abyssalis]